MSVPTDSFKMDNLELQNFEQQCKMTKPGVGLTSSAVESSSVKFKELFYTPNAKEPFYIQNKDQDVETPSQVPKEESPLNGRQFFKDPLGQISGPQEIEDNSEKKLMKLGHNMRACVGESTRRHHTTQIDVMNARRCLLEKMRHQGEMYSKREMAKEDATVLVNKLLSHGFQISPPNDSPRFECATPMTTESADNYTGGNSPEADIVRSIHEELKRVQGYKQS